MAHETPPEEEFDVEVREAAAGLIALHGAEVGNATTEKNDRSVGCRLA